jgi:hypothetical protein
MHPWLLHRPEAVGKENPTMQPQRHPDDIPLELGPLADYLADTYHQRFSAWTLADLCRRDLVPATKIRGKWRTTARAVLDALSPVAA